MLFNPLSCVAYFVLLFLVFPLLPTWRIKKLVLFAFMLPATLRGELAFQEVIIDNVYHAYERDVGDANSDGLNDVIAVREGDTTVEWFQAPDFSRSTLINLTGTYRWPRADDFKTADMDGDDDMDVIVRLGSGPSDDGTGIAVWYENLGGGSNWTQRLIGTSIEYVKDIVIADLDRDARPDVIMRMDSQTQIWLQNTNGTWAEVLLSHAPHEGLEAGDIDHDGDPDIVLNGFWFPTPDTPATCRNAASYTNRTIDSAWFTQSGDWTANSCKVSIGDINGDSTNDIVFSQSERAGYNVTWYRKASGETWTGTPITVIDYCHNLQAVDFDLDGDTDIMAGGMIQSPHRGLRLFLNEGNGQAWTTFYIQSNGSYSAELGDIDNDSDLDVVGILNWDSAPTYIYRNNSAGPPSLDFWTHLPVSASHVQTFGLTFPDIDSDGDLDIASGPYVYRNPGSPMTGVWNQATAAAGKHIFLSTDVDGDDRVDIFALQDNPGQNRIDLYWIEAAQATATSWSAPVTIGNIPRSDHTIGFQGYHVADIEIGGLPELIISSLHGIYYFTIPANPDAGNWPKILIATNDSDEGIAVSAINADAHPDIAFTRGGDKSVRWARNPGNSNGNWQVHVIGSFPEADWPDRCEASDINGDGRVDIVVTEENTGNSPDALAYWWEQPVTSPTNANWIRHLITTRYTMNSMDSADVDLDGDTDLIIAEHRGSKKISAFENDGAGLFIEHPISSGRESHLGGRLADLDGDGDLDVTSIAYDDFTHLNVWRNDSPSGTPRVAKPVITPNGGAFDEPLSITITCGTADAIIWYSLDGTVPTNQAPSLLYTGTPILISTSTVIMARAFKTDFDTSTPASATFVGPKVLTPVISPPGGTFAESALISISCATTGVIIRYTTQGEEPGVDSEVYTESILLQTSAVIRARAFRNGLSPSDTATATFTRFFIGAIAHWRLDERFGTAAIDSSESGHDGIVNGASWNSGIKDQALSFDGNDDHVNVGTWDISGTGLTICAWIRLDGSFSGGDSRILSKATGINEQDHYWMLSLTTAGPDNRLRFRLKSGGSTATLVANSGHLSPSTWYHAAATYDGAAMNLYLNGTNSGSMARSGQLDTSPAIGIMIGANPPTIYAPFHGIIDDVRVYNTALSAGDILTIMSENPAGPAPEVSGFTLNSQGFPTLHMDGEIGHYFILQSAVDLLTPSWMNLHTTPCVTTTLSWPITGAAPHAVFRTLKD